MIDQLVVARGKSLEVMPGKLLEVMPGKSLEAATSYKVLLEVIYWELTYLETFLLVKFLEGIQKIFDDYEERLMIEFNVTFAQASAS